MGFPTNLLLANLVMLAGFAHSFNFWRLPCRNRIAAARIDPIMAPGETCDHMHTIFGSGGFSDNVTQDDLLDANCTSCAVTQDKSAYWTPPLMFVYSNGSTTMVNQDGGMLAYYFVYGEDPQPFPESFRMMAGDQFLRNFTGPVPDPPTSEWTDADKTQFSLSQKAIGFNCLHYNTTNEDSLYRHTMPEKDFLDENCWDGLRIELMFPSCWNGVDVDSPDHKSHMAYPDLVKDGKCPEGFNTRLVSLFYETKYDTQDFRGVEGQFVLSTGDPTGCGYHGDFIQGWEPDFLQEAMNGCTNPSGEVSDCPLFTDNADASTCQIALPEALVDENPFFNLHGLLGDVPIQSGPEQATPYGFLLPAPTSPGLPVPAGGIIGSLGDVVSGVVTGLAAPVPSEAPSDGRIQAAQVPSTTCASKQALPTGVSRDADDCEVVIVRETAVVEVGNDGVPITTLAPVGSTTTSTKIVAMPMNNLKREQFSTPGEMSSLRRMHNRHLHNRH
ncbi:hypothetical protein UA08_00571 [Talaromyces atroroseus]|uniref:DUF1996 domain-containing protein n=1 Tax=Talaromyces atroroseus TaxID=1441469 RepID=A0A225B9K6_TALAT|nr:hypothetical protein UA08_00571 [Talaromyces atroroseus]OKL64076.1 hypothetical protein UA08_00571 [Talaromyces atroroseus]